MKAAGLLAAACAAAGFAFAPVAAAQEKLVVWFTKGFYAAEDKALDEMVAKFEKKTGVKALHTIAGAAVPAVAVVTKLASSLEKQSGLLANKLAGKKAAVKVAAVKRVTPFRKARARKAA